MKFMIICGKNKGGDNDEGRNNAEKKAKELSGEWNNVLSVFFIYIYVYVRIYRYIYIYSFNAIKKLIFQ